MEVTQEQVDFYQEHGAVLLKQVIPPHWIEQLKLGIAETVAHPSVYSERLRAPGGPGSYFNDYCNWRHIAPLRDFVYDSHMARLAARLMHSQTAVFYHEHVLTKDAGTYKRTPWHQDQPYYPIDGFQNCSVWVPVDAVDESSSIQFVAGSHRWGRWFYPRKFATSHKYTVEFENTSGRLYEDIPDFDRPSPEWQILKWACEPGDCVAFHMLTVHGAPENRMCTPRRVVSFRWLGDDCVLAERPWQVSPPITGGLSVGSHVACDAFPLVYNCSKNTDMVT